MEPRRGLVRAVEVAGIGLHSGVPARARIAPAPAGHGIAFLRADLPDPVAIPAHWSAVVGSDLCTCLGRGGQRVDTVEHVLAALTGLGVDDARVEIHGPELPALDGSAQPWLAALVHAGLVQTGTWRTTRILSRVLALREGPRAARCEPADGLRIEVGIDFPHPGIGGRVGAWTLGPEVFERELCWARTFALEPEVRAMQARGLARGGSLDNAVVFGVDGVLNPGGLRGPDEPLRHKALDLLGDLALLGAPLRARVRVERPGHAFNLALVRALAAATEPACPC